MHFAFLCLSMLALSYFSQSSALKSVTRNLSTIGRTRRAWQAVSRKNRVSNEGIDGEPAIEGETVNLPIAIDLNTRKVGKFVAGKNLLLFFLIIV